MVLLLTPIPAPWTPATDERDVEARPPIDPSATGARVRVLFTPAVGPQTLADRLLGPIGL